MTDITIRAPAAPGNAEQAQLRLEGRQRLLSQKQLPTKCDFCDGLIQKPGKSPIGPTGFAWWGEDKRAACYRCCAWLELIQMAECRVGGRLEVALYYSEEPPTDEALGRGLDAYGSIGNWPGSLQLRVYAKGPRLLRKQMRRETTQGYKQQIYFRGPNGSHWSGTFYSTNVSGNDLRNVRRISKSVNGRRRAC